MTNLMENPYIETKTLIDDHNHYQIFSCNLDEVLSSILCETMWAITTS